MVRMVVVVIGSDVDCGSCEWIVCFFFMVRVVLVVEGDCASC